MREVGVGIELKRYELMVDGRAYGQVDRAGDETASLVLAPLPEFPVALEPEQARQLVEAWGQRANIGAQPYAVRAEEREV